MEWLLFSVILLIMFFFYQQHITEFRINQVEWSQKDHIKDLLSERAPVIIRSLPLLPFWTLQDATQRSSFKHLSIFHKVTLPEWLNTDIDKDRICPWKDSQAEQIASLGLSIWAEQINPHIKHLWMFTKYHCWAGQVGLRKMISWTCLIPTEQEIIVTIMTPSVTPFLPPKWMGQFPTEWTEKDTPFMKDLKYMDIIIRPGTCIIIPAHWYASWTGKGTPMVCMISYHTIMSRIAYQLSPWNE